mgnify:CR=1 FL=1
MPYPITAYNCDSPAEVRAALDDLMDEAFGFRFAGWHGLGVWNEDYTGCAIFSEGRMLANASLYRMELAVEGRAEAGQQLP